MGQAPIQFDRASGALEGANLWERTAALALVTGSKISSHFSHMGYIACANLLRKTLPERNIAIKLNSDAVFGVRFTDRRPLRTWADLLTSDKTLHLRWSIELLKRGILVNPNEKFYISLAHTDADVDRTLEAIEDCMRMPSTSSLSRPRSSTSSLSNWLIGNPA